MPIAKTATRVNAQKREGELLVRFRGAASEQSKDNVIAARGGRRKGKALGESVAWTSRALISRTTFGRTLPRSQGWRIPRSKCLVFEISGDVRDNLNDVQLLFAEAEQSLPSSSVSIADISSQHQ